jgi:hypothetical protein
MKRLCAIAVAAFALTIYQPSGASAQRGGMRAGGGGTSFHGGHVGGGNRGASMHGATSRGGIWRPVSGARPGRGWAGATGVAAGTWGYGGTGDYYGEPNNEQCIFMTHYGRTFIC